MSVDQLMTGDLKALVSELTVAEKIALLSGYRMWKTAAIERLGIPSIVMTDGTYGVRYSIPQIDGDEAGGQDFEAFLSMVGRRADHVQVAWGEMRPATCFPNGSSLGCSWDVNLAHRLGQALGAECQAYGVHLLLGPGINIRRTPLAGRAYEYYSEDPVLTGDFAAGVINGLQATGVGASLKHFACNNSEVERTTMDSVVEERVLREIYLKGFERAIAKSSPWTVMSSYNRLNGIQAAQHFWLLTKVLREDWGYDGLVVSDWHGIKDRPASLLAGNDLDMPESDTRKRQLAAAIEAGDVPIAAVDAACERVLYLVRKAKTGERRGIGFDAAAHHKLARRMAAECMVLLKNDNALLPISPNRVKRIVVIGEGAGVPVIQGSGCATTTPTEIDIPIEEILALKRDITVDRYRGTSGDASEHRALIAEAAAGATGADVVVIFVNSEDGYDGEGSDRTSLDLAIGHADLIRAVAAVNPNVAVVIASPDAVVMPWADDVRAIVALFYSGQAMGGGLADILFGIVNPCGKLTTTFPKRLEDLPTYLSYPGENGRHIYSEDIFVGYRWYDARGIEPAFPFGHGLSYTRFHYSDLSVDSETLEPGGSVQVTFKVTNTGDLAGKEICQLYASYASPRFRRPVRELKAFSKTELQPNETTTISLTLTAHDLSLYDTSRQAWVLDDDVVTLSVGASSRDIRLATLLKTRASIARHRRVDLDTQPVFVLANPIARRKFNQFLQQRLGVDEPGADRLLEHCANSFFGIFTTFDRRFRQSFPKSEIQELLDAINAEMAMSPRRVKQADAEQSGSVSALDNSRTAATAATDQETVRIGCQEPVRQARQSIP